MSSPLAFVLLSCEEEWHSFPYEKKGMFDFGICDEDLFRPIQGFDDLYGHIIFLNTDHLVGILIEMIEILSVKRFETLAFPKRFILRCVSYNTDLAKDILPILYRNGFLVSMETEGNFYFQFSRRGFEVAKYLRMLHNKGKLKGVNAIRTNGPYTFELVYSEENSC